MSPCLSHQTHSSQRCSGARRCDALGGAAFRLTQSGVGRAKVVSVAAPAGQTHSLSPFLLVCFIHIQGFSPSFHPTHRTIYLSTGVSIKRPHPHTNCVTLQPGVHKRLGKSLDCAVSGRKKCTHSQRPWPWSRSASCSRVDVRGEVAA